MLYWVVAGITLFQLTDETFKSSLCFWNGDSLDAGLLLFMNFAKDVDGFWELKCSDFLKLLWKIYVFDRKFWTICFLYEVSDVFRIELYELSFKEEVQAFDFFPFDGCLLGS